MASALGLDDYGTSSSDEEEEKVVEDQVSDESTQEVKKEDESSKQRSGHCDPAIEARVAHFLKLKAQGHDFMTNLRAKKDFWNPCILSQVAEYFSIDEIQSHFSTFDPHALPVEEYYDNLGSYASNDVMHGY